MDGKSIAAEANPLKIDTASRRAAMAQFASNADSINRMGPLSGSFRFTKESIQKAMKEFQFTLYEIFGYLIPGIITLCAAAMIFGAFFVNAPLNIDGINSSIVTGLLFCSYLTGHFTQAFSNQVFTSFLKPTVDLVLKPGSSLSLSPALIKESESVAKSLIKSSSTNDLKPSQIFEVCDIHLQQFGKTETRDIFVYREGFYRGVCTSFAFLAIGFSVRLFCLQSEFKFTGMYYHLSKTQLVLLTLASLLFSYLFFNRFRRFGRYLVANAVLSALVIKTSTDKKADASES